MANPADYRPSNIPAEPGVYRFYDQNDRVIYVGKAKNLKNRLNSYFGSNLATKTDRMVHTAIRVDWTIVGTEVEALALEYTWIKSENPQFNVQFKDDKTYPYLAVSLSERFPRLYVSRQKHIKGNRYFGPFTNTWALRGTVEVLQRIFPIRACSQSNFNRAVATKRQCLLGDIGKCAAPCVGWISEEEHSALAKKLITYLDRNPTDIAESIQLDMERAATNEEFELAARLRDQLEALSKTTEFTETSLNNNFSADLIGIHEEITHAAASLFSIRAGRIIASRAWIIDLRDVLEGEDVISAALAKIYLDNKIPTEILVDREPTDAVAIADWLSVIAGHKVSITVPQRGEKFEMLRTVQRNANQALIQYLSKRSNDSAVVGKALEEIHDALNLPELPLRIECFDISNIQGKHMVASMIVFEDGQPKKSDYRRFAIDDDAGFDDTRAMNHILTRRLKRYLAEREIDINELKMQGGARPKFAYPPQLIVVDGGAPQVNAAYQALRSLGLENIPLVGLAKRLEEVWLPNNSDPIILPRHSEGLYLLQRVRDEAHRFAINFHRSKRSAVMLESLLDEIPLLGEVRRKALLDRFGSVGAIRKATLAQIAEVPGIGEKIALLITESLTAEQSGPAINLGTGEIGG
ncbi:MAG TPA: excinuclease ABC subunit UvrC [Candidatus Nanopelagicaceae bacterium]